MCQDQAQGLWAQCCSWPGVARSQSRRCGCRGSSALQGPAACPPPRGDKGTGCPRQPGAMGVALSRRRTKEMGHHTGPLPGEPVPGSHSAGMLPPPPPSSLAQGSCRGVLPLWLRPKECAAEECQEHGRSILPQLPPREGRQSQPCLRLQRFPPKSIYLPGREQRFSVFVCFTAIAEHNRRGQHSADTRGYFLTKPCIAVSEK